MRRSLLFCLLACLFVCLPALPQSTTITATHIAQDPSGALLASGKLCLLPVNQAGIPSGFEANSTQYMPQLACSTITNGAVSGLSVPDTADIQPSGIGFRVSFEDAAGNTLYRLAQPIYPTGTTWSLDTWSPTVSAAVPGPVTISAGVNAPQGRCSTGSLYFNATNSWKCFNSIWVLETSGSGGSAFVGGTLTSPLYLSEDPQTGTEAATKNYVDTQIAAIPTVTSGAINSALGYTPASAADISSAISSVPTVTSANIIAALGYTPLSVNDLQPYLQLQGGSMTGALNLSDGSPAASQSWVTSQIAAAISNTGTGSTGGGTTWNDNIGTVVRSGSMSDGSIAMKNCYVGSSVCSGGVGAQAPASTPTRSAGLNSPSANTGTSNAVEVMSISTAVAAPTYTMALWTTTNSGLGSDTTSTNWARDFWVKTAFASGITNLEFDLYNFDGQWDMMLGTQCNGHSYLIQYANQSSSWANTAVPCSNLYDGNWHHIQMTAHHELSSGSYSCTGSGGTAAPCEVWDTIAIDGTVYILNKTMPETATTWLGSGGQTQIDLSPTSASSASPATDTVYIDTDTVIAGTAPNNGATGPGGNGGTTTAELGSFNFDGASPLTGLTTTGSPAVSTTQAKSGSDSLSCPAGNNYVSYTLPNSTNVLYTGVWVYLPSYGSTASDWLQLYGNGNLLMTFYFNAGNGFLEYWNQATNTGTAMSSSAPTTGTWHLIETYTKIDATAGQVIAKMDGVTVYTSAANLNTGTAAITSVTFGQKGNTAPVGWGTEYLDSVDFSAVGWIGD